MRHVAKNAGLRLVGGGVLALVAAVLVTVAANMTLTGAAQAFQLQTDYKTVPAGSYKLDPSHTNVIFKISHLGYSTYIGRFDRISGSLQFDPQKPQASTAEITIAAASINTNHKVLEEKLRSAKFFDAEKFPTISFKSDRLEIEQGQRGKLSGILTLHGVAKPVTLDVIFNGGAINPFAKSFGIGFSARGRIKRSDFGITANLPMIGDAVALEIETEFLKPKP